ncbi:DUF4159 domain-containing protein [Mangrovicoccus algicola]|uniref:DUF4159 domain-containing protein n=1 Tax=Mangrovicoccus algicola TaxID=2771008 RepID=A0A8J6YVP1_9RHOB|nr:DUF4159 domain-containing protein [Mangrovicoccus algicola]MBE3636923.1 DUF4159 domain-containing protein [Mangrovicoccus algicola]
MLTLGPLGFTAPALLLALLALPLLWLVLRAVPPAPVRRRFPGVALLLGLDDRQSQTDRTPWWLLLLRLAAVALVILGFAGPVLNPAQGGGGGGPVLVLLDGTWADAGDWARRIDRAEAALTEAARDGRPAAVAVLSDPGAAAPAFQAAEAWLERLPALVPAPWEPDPEAVADWAGALPEGAFDTLWLSDGLARDGRDALLAALEDHGAVRVFEGPRPVLALRPARYEEGAIVLEAIRARAEGAQDVAVDVRGRDPAGTEQVLARAEGSFAPGAQQAEIRLSLPAELRNRVTRFEIAGLRSAGAVSLADDGLRRREIGLLSGQGDGEGFELLSPLHYLRQALAPDADLIESDLSDMLLANPDVLILADVARLSPAEETAIRDWVEAGGMLLRFAGPRLAASDVSRAEEDPLMPVRLREGGRSVGGAMSWGAPKTLMPFEAGSPFAGLAIPGEVAVTAQVLAQPDPDLAERTIAALQDGTPLVTRKPLGEGQVVLFHVTANAEWSSLPLSGLFMSMLERLSVAAGAERPAPEALAGTTWVPEDVLDGFGTASEAGTMAGVPGERLAAGRPAPDMPPGLYAGEDRRLALNVIGSDTVLVPAAWPDRIPVEGLEIRQETPLKGAVLMAALLLLLADLLASMALSGKLPRPRRSAGPAAAILLAGAVALAPPQARAQEAQADARAVAATSEVTLAYVRSSDPQVDEITRAGLAGLSDVLYARTSIEPADPTEIDIETDELSFFPLIYWAVTADQPLPSAEAYGRLNRYLRTGGMIVFDTRDADVAGFGGTTPEGRRLQEIAAGLDIPPLEPVPQDHVLTRAFYLLQDFPGRYAGREVWVEAAPPDASAVEGMPFRDLNDGVTPVVIGGNDWAGAWATDEARRPMLRVGSGLGGERQREVAYRFGVNLVMHVLTGNYKSDQVHVPALLDRLGN